MSLEQLGDLNCFGLVASRKKKKYVLKKLSIKMLNPFGFSIEIHCNDNKKSILSPGDRRRKFRRLSSTSHIQSLFFERNHHQFQRHFAHTTDDELWRKDLLCNRRFGASHLSRFQQLSNCYCAKSVKTIPSIDRA